uniref:Uncharacterized protein n=1 Tax=Siphoviridae sp. ctWlk2 TaxID=2825539 RepID=A0A8S5U6T3_9CAUD|nr:MAG TPA: hypothetical protein [Siphoviridae sp. ctWlk2]
MIERLYKKRKPQKSFCFFFCYFKTKTYICDVVHLNQARWLAIFMLRAFFMPCGLPYRISSVPCGVLMDPLPDSGVRQRGAELFLFSSRTLSKYCFILNVVQK